MKIQIPTYENAAVLIFGDVMLDRYWYGSTHRISPEAPVPVVHVKEMDERPGGAGNVALNITSLGAQSTLFGICGDDEAAHKLEMKLCDARVKNYLHKVKEIPTVTKLRILSQHQQLIRLDFEEQVHTVSIAPLISTYQQALKNHNIVILSDYAKGSLQQIKTLIQLAKEANVPTLVDPKNNDFNLYNHATVITPNLKEFEAVVGRCVDDAHLAEKATTLLREHHIEAILITRGEHGMTLVRQNHAPLHLPAEQREVYDVTGAGDTVIAVLAASMAAGSDLSTATHLANLAAGISVSKLGAATVTIPELRKALLYNHDSTARGVVTEEQLLVILQESRAMGERIVMTGGCFDILHSGHITYLEKARALGDRLIVAVNNDASVKQLKGDQRPINTLIDRMTVLAGLSAIDWVVPFSDLTPERIISSLKPDIWVKGGDYTVEKLPETKNVHAYGGEIKILEFVEGHSTSNIIERIQAEETV